MNVGRWLIITGLVLVTVGGLLTVIERVPAFTTALSWFGKLPGDLAIRRERFSLYIPITTSLVLSLLLSLVLYILSWLFRR